MKAYTYTSDGDGKGKEGAIPADLADAAQKAHEALVEMVAEGNDALLEEFFEKGTLPVEHIIEGLRQAVRETPHFSGAVRLRAAQCRQRSAPELHHREFSGAHRARPMEGNRQGGSEVERADQGYRARFRPSCSRPSPIPSPAAYLTSR